MPLPASPLCAPAPAPVSHPRPERGPGSAWPARAAPCRVCALKIGSGGGAGRGPAPSPWAWAASPAPGWGCRRRLRPKGSAQPTARLRSVAGARGKREHRLGSGPWLPRSRPSSHKQKAPFPGARRFPSLPGRSLLLPYFVPVPFPSSVELPCSLDRQKTPPRPLFPAPGGSSPRGAAWVAPLRPARNSVEEGRLCISFYCILNDATAFEPHERLKFSGV